MALWVVDIATTSHIYHTLISAPVINGTLIGPYLTPPLHGFDSSLLEILRGNFMLFFALTLSCHLPERP